MRGDCRHRRTYVVFVLLAVALSHLASCESVERFSKYFREDFDSSPGPTALDGNDVTLVVRPHRLIETPVYYTARDTLNVHFFFDSSYVDIAQVKGYALWRRDQRGGFWQKVKTTSIHELPMTIELEDQGAYGLQASAVYHDGREMCVPRTEEEALVWVHADRTAPALRWIFPLDGEILPRDTDVSLRWSAREAEFGARDMYVDWSEDEGKTWFMIGKVKARAGDSSLDWRVPSALYGRGILRVTTRDLVGNESSINSRFEFVPPEGWDLRHEVAGLPGPSSSTGVQMTFDAETGLATATSAADPSEVVHQPRQATADTDGGLRAANPGQKNFALEGDGSASIQIVNLPEGSVVKGGSARYVFFETSNFHERTAIVRGEARNRSSEPWTLFAPGVPASTRKLLVKFPAETHERHQIRLTATDERGNVAVIERLVPVDAETPVARIRALRRDPSGAMTVQLECHDRGPAGVDKAFVFVSRDRGRSWKRLSVPDPYAPVTLPGDAAMLGLWVSAVDRVGHESPVPVPGTQPMRILDSSRRIELELVTPSRKVLRGGDELILNWKHSESVPAATVLTIELSPNGVTGWEFQGQASAGARRTLLILPRRDGESFVLRATATLPDGSILDSRTERFALDASPPQLTLGDVPTEAGTELRFPLAATDPGPAELEKIQCLVRPRGTQEWRRLAAINVETKEGHAKLSLQDLNEGDWELTVIASDSVGNHSGPSSATRFFRLDKTPSTLVVKPTAVPWIEGRPSAIQVEYDVRDAVPPLVLEGRAPGAEWGEIHRWATLPPGQDLFHFTLPVGHDRYELRVWIRDRVGNISRALLGPRDVETSIVLQSFSAGERYSAGQYHPVRWRLHPALATLESDLVVEVSHRRDPKADWHKVYDGLPTNSSCVWTVPKAMGGEHRLRLRLFHEGDLVGESISSDPFHIVETVTRQPSKEKSVGDLSLYYSKRGHALLQNYKRVQADYQRYYNQATASLRRDATGKVEGGQEALLPPETQRQLHARREQARELESKVRQQFDDALHNDPANYHAAYGHAQLRLMGSKEQLDEAVSWLMRTVKMQPGHIDALNDLGAGYIRLGRYRDAAGVLKEAIRRDDRADLHYNLGLALFFLNDQPGARAHFSRALSKGSPGVHTGEVYYYLVASMIREGDKQNATELFASQGSAIPVKLRGALESALNRM